MDVATPHLLCPLGGKFFKKYLFTYLFKNIFIDLAAPGLSYSTWDLQFSFWHAGPLL